MTCRPGASLPVAISFPRAWSNRRSASWRGGGGEACPLLRSCQTPALPVRWRSPRAELEKLSAAAASAVGSSRTGSMCCASLHRETLRVSSEGGQCCSALAAPVPKQVCLHTARLERHCHSCVSAALHAAAALSRAGQQQSKACGPRLAGRGQHTSRLAQGPSAAHLQHPAPFWLCLHLWLWVQHPQCHCQHMQSSGHPMRSQCPCLLALNKWRLGAGRGER